tara:strand:+ start:15991 stop:16356 length:366 start_codon:yes stop_codon:yes gene_type:complete
VIKNGFKIENGEIWDIQIQTYALKRKSVGNNIIYYMEEYGYKRLYHFDALLDSFPIDKVFKILEFNSYLRKQRYNDTKLNSVTLSHVFNYSSIYNYPPSFLTSKRFATYKKIQHLKKRLHQ